MTSNRAASTAPVQSLNLLGLTGYLFIGTAAVLIPSIMPSISAEFTAAGLTLGAIGLIFPARAAGGILGNLLSGVGSDLIGRRRSVWLSAFLLAAALALTALARPWILFVAGFVLVSAAQGALSTGINAMVADANRGARARALNRLHGVYGAGAAVSPLIFGYLIQADYSWRWALGGTGLIWLIYGLIVYRLYRTSGGHEEQAGKQRFDLSMLKAAPFLALFVIAFLYNGIAVSLLGWVALFLEESVGAPPILSIGSVSLFYLALTLGRFGSGPLAERRGYGMTLLILALIVGLTYPLVVFGNLPVLAAGVFLTGLGLSGLFPTAMAYASRLYPEQTGTVSGTLNVALTFGSMVPPLWTGLLAGIGGFQFALGINYVLVLPLLLLALYLFRLEKAG